MFIRYEKSNLVKLDILLNRELVDAFSMIVHESMAYARGRFVCEKLKEIIPMHRLKCRSRQPSDRR
jgi:GTP-binding protein LepA